MLPTFLLAALALQAEAPEPITVFGHPWAPFISPMGEPFRARASGDDTLALWFHQADRDRDGALTAAEMEADAIRFFRLLDADHDNVIRAEEMANYELEIAPEIQVNSGWRRDPGEPRPDRKKRNRAGGYDPEGLQGGARYALLNMPQPVAAADTNIDQVVTFEEFRRAATYRFGLLDRHSSTRLTLAQLQALLPDSKTRRRTKNKIGDPDARIGTRVPL